MLIYKSILRFHFELPDGNCVLTFIIHKLEVKVHSAYVQSTSFTGTNHSINIKNMHEQMYYFHITAFQSVTVLQYQLKVCKVMISKYISLRR